MQFVAALSFLLAAGAADAEPPCRSAAHGKALDFWLGEWTVASEDGATRFGENRIERALDGCAVFEHWRGASGGEGKSLFYFDARADRWEQIWVTADTTRPGGLKRKLLVDFAGAGVRFQGELKSEAGAPYLDRTTLTPLEDGRVRQLIEISTDDGATWKATFDGYYAAAN
ncbi:MAG TPA: hypothetical protein PKM48_07215 [Parvularculaceae bacterium]|nr:hypothetical protein [Parvularculaceae bacterium]